jgi:hypothetical protein
VGPGGTGGLGQLPIQDPGRLGVGTACKTKQSSALDRIRQYL